MKSKYSRTNTSRSVHESRVFVGQDMFLVSGYWDSKADINRSVFSVMRIIWRGELSVVCAGRYVPYHKRMKGGHKADIAVKRYVVISFIPLVSILRHQIGLQRSSSTAELSGNLSPERSLTN